ncbi:NAD-dependent epimerase/dehydratase family protein [uncultured Devosia sp.]|uniref:NAD-dependent epimerase/dehydratase family protein n=1 Tax=uncultured Devosia sp. TaxID=211434 RepID=UPI00261F7ADA|nr:NAD-dependent epimerase/dehydratase family protein [uncultured Devosia sp.]
MSARYLVTGANGFVGRAVCRALQDHGAQARGVVRIGAEPGPGIDALRLDLLDAEKLPRAVDGCEVVIHLAGAAHGKLGRSADLEAFRRVNTRATLDLAAAAQAAGARRFVFVSTIGVHGSLGRRAAITEASPEAPNTYYGQSKCEAEHGLRALLSTSGMELCIVRPPLVYGPDAPGNFRLLLKLAATGIPLPLASVRNRRSLIALTNLVHFLELCSVHPAAAGQTFVVSDQQDVSTPEILQHIWCGMSLRPRLVPLPPQLLHLAAALFGKRTMVRQLTDSLWIDTEKSSRLLGWSAPQNAAEALAAAGRDYLGLKDRT